MIYAIDEIGCGTGAIVDVEHQAICHGDDTEWVWSEASGLIHRCRYSVVLGIDEVKLLDGHFVLVDDRNGDADTSAARTGLKFKLDSADGGV